jgi:Phosphate-selective porin O and P
MKTKYLVAVALLAFGISQFISAQDSIATQQSSEERIKNLETTVGSLPQIGGFVNLREQYSTQNNNVGKNGFDVRRVYLNFNGKLGKELTYRAQLDAAGTPKVLDAYAEWKPFKFIGLQVGQFKVPYTLENPYSPNTLETTENSQVITNLVVNNPAGTSNNGRDIGLSLNGNFFSQEGYNWIDYKLGVYNGNLINAVDNNKAKDLSATILINPIKALSLGASIYGGEWGADNTNLKRDRTSFGLKYDDGKLLVRGEYLKGSTATLNAKNAIVNTDANGYYVVAGYYFTKKIQPIVKYDFYQSDASLSTTPITNYVVGLNYWASSKVRLQFNYTRVDYKDTSKSNSDSFVTQLFLAF